MVKLGATGVNFLCGFQSLMTILDQQSLTNNCQEIQSIRSIAPGLCYLY